MIELTVVGEQEQTFGVFIKSTSRERFEMFVIFGEKINYDRIFVIPGRTEISGILLFLCKKLFLCHFQATCIVPRKLSDKKLQKASALKKRTVVSLFLRCHLRE